MTLSTTTNQQINNAIRPAAVDVNKRSSLPLSNINKTVVNGQAGPKPGPINRIMVTGGEFSQILAGIRNATLNANTGLINGPRGTPTQGLTPVIIPATSTSSPLTITAVPVPIVRTTTNGVESNTGSNNNTSNPSNATSATGASEDSILGF